MTKDIIKLKQSNKLEELKAKLDKLKTKEGLAVPSSVNLEEWAILADFSYSMNALIKNGKHAYQEMIATLQDVLKTHNIDIIKFESHATLISPQKIQLCYPCGGTNLAEAFRVAKTQDKKNVILLTDGQPDSEFEALRESEGLKIEIIFIGDPPMPEFLMNLARDRGGSSSIEKLNAELTSAKIKGLLPAG